MHWFWRAVIADLDAIIPLGLLLWLTGPDALGYALGLSVVLVAGLSVPMLTIFSHLTHRYRPWLFDDDETRCRKCAYILRGITEPRCPECGERI